MFKNTKKITLIVSLFLIVGMFVLTHTTEALRFTNRSMFISTAQAGENAFYQISFNYPTTSVVGSLRLEFCDSPIPSTPCTLPPGLDISGAVLAAQSGETGYTISQHTSTVIVLSRTPSMTSASLSTYRLDNITNPSSETQDFYVRMTDYVSNDATGSFIDFGSVTAQLAPPIGVYTQVPPILVFCVAEQINDDNCNSTNGSFADYGELSTTQTRSSTSELLARTNASSGYSITVMGRTMTSGIHAIPQLTTPTSNAVGVGQFGMNLAVNSNPAGGASPVGPGVNAVINSDYNQPDKYLFRDGDIIVTSNGITPTRKFTANYIVNIAPDQAPGVYSTTISYICLAGF